MPTVLRSGPYRFYFYAGDRGEPPHIRVERDDDMAKLVIAHKIANEWRVFPFRNCSASGHIVAEYQTQLLEAWNAYFND